MEEIHFRNEGAFFCLIINRRLKTIRVVDFRAGVLPAKRQFIRAVAERESIEKVITIVERDEVSSWSRSGFQREASIPGFYKRSDAYLCGFLAGAGAAAQRPSESSLKQLEKNMATARKNAKKIGDIEGITPEKSSAEEVLPQRDRAWEEGLALGAFDPWGRGTDREYWALHAPKTQRATNYFYTESQEWFGHAFVELLYPPEGAEQLEGSIAGLRGLGDLLKARGLVSAFAFAPGDDLTLCTLFLAAGFRKTGFIARGATLQGRARDLIVWTRKLATFGGDDEP